MARFDRLTESRWAYAVLAGLVFLLALPGLFALPVLDRDEGRFTEASSEMMESGDYVVIRYHDELRNKKPVAIHWFQSAVVSLTSGPEARNIADYRIPSMLGAILAALATFWAGTALFSRRAAFIAAVVLGTTLLLTTEANIAKTDAAQCGILALGMGALRAVGGGAEHGSRLVVLRWPGKLKAAPVAFVGKGVCFDTGGISIKPAAGMEDEPQLHRRRADGLRRGDTRRLRRRRRARPALPRGRGHSARAVGAAE
jgi:4-amino-4-deoxy-L-arabinose transferase-like glycosyltransferase